ncbi:MAG: threonine synthase [Proteocatella sp.]
MTKFFSTRNENEIITGPQAIIRGIATDGGLYVPDRFRNIDYILKMDGSYCELCLEILKSFFPELELKNDIEKAYSKFYKNPPAQLEKLGDRYILELYHGPTSAFKDFALVVLPHLMKRSKELEGNDEKTVILTATSGDTGKAALEGFANIEESKIKDISIVVIYPQDGVSDVQKRQMITQEGDNVHVIGIKGNFDHAQTAVKEIFADKKLSEELRENGISFSSANSINIGRLVPQIAYYFHAYKELLSRGEIATGEKISFCVPTGNFGDILAGYYAKKMGLPVDKLVCASNENNVLVDFFESGKYDKKRELQCTASPSMDIVISSNLERLLYHMSGSTQKVAKWMKALNENGEYTIFGDDEDANNSYREVLDSFASGTAGKNQSYEAIRTVFEEYSYLMDPHTAVAYHVALEQKTKSKMVILSTASPFKFASSVCEALGLKTDVADEFEMLKLLSRESGCEIPKPLQNLDQKPVLHSLYIDKEEIKNTIRNLLLEK